MSKEGTFLIYCMERYRHFKGLTGAEVAALFERYDVYGYVTRYFEALHTMSERSIVEDLEGYIQQKATEQ